ncbi:MAG: DNA polymerase III subunit delta [Gemmatimonadetes bacterium]|nr:DNA polymerase III subunit delta [Gemmatimonadota bacterium]
MDPLKEIPSLARARGGAFYLHGEDDFRKEEIVRALVDAHLDPATADFNLDLLRGSEVDTETLASVLATPPMMAEWRVVVLREVEALASSPRARDVLLGTVEDLPPGLALVMSCTVPQGSKAKFYQELAKKAVSVELRPIGDADAPGWLMARAREVHGLEMDEDAARALGTAVGAAPGVLAMELSKLAEFAGERGRITLADVEAAGTRLPSQDRWRWFDLVGEGDFQAALDTVGVLLGQGETGVGLVIGLTTHLLRLGVVVDKGPAALEEVLPRHQRWLARRLASQARRWTSEGIESAVEGLLRVDRLLKASPLSDVHLLEEWLMGLAVRKAAA